MSFLNNLFSGSKADGHVGESPFLDPFSLHSAHKKEIPVTLISQFESMVTANAQGIALVTEENIKVSYSELQALAQNISRKILQKTGDDGKPHLVGIVMERDVGFIAAILGTLMSRATYVPVDPSFPPDRQTHILSHSNCELTIIDQINYTKAIDMGVQLPPWYFFTFFASFLSLSLSLPPFHTPYARIRFLLTHKCSIYLPLLFFVILFSYHTA